MKINIKNILIIILFFITSCEESSTTGSINVSEIEYVSFTNLITSITENSLIASGIITNTSQTVDISPPWYIECQFYYRDNSGNTFLIGGENVRINNSLLPGISLEWTLENQIENAGSYQNFTISDLRAYKN